MLRRRGSAWKKRVELEQSTNACSSLKALSFLARRAIRALECQGPRCGIERFRVLGLGNPD